MSSTMIEPYIRRPKEPPRLDTDVLHATVLPLGSSLSFSAPLSLGLILDSLLAAELPPRCCIKL